MVANVLGLNITKICHLPGFQNFAFFKINYINGLVQDCSNSIANAMELLQPCIKPYIWSRWKLYLISPCPTGIFMQHFTEVEEFYDIDT